MKLQGIYDPEKQYAVDDIVLIEGSALAYRLTYPAPAGTPPTDTQHWTTVDQMLSQCAWLIVSYNAKAEPAPEPEKEYVNPKPASKRTKKKEANE